MIMADVQEVRVVAPLGDLDWIEDAFDCEPEEEDGQQVFYVQGSTPKKVSQVLTKKAKGYAISVKGSDVVLEPKQGVPWFSYPRAAHSAYDKAVKAEIQRVAEDPARTAWWAAAPYRRLLVVISSEEFPWSFAPVKDDRALHPGETGGDLLVEARFEDQARALAREHVEEILRRVAEYLN